MSEIRDGQIIALRRLVGEVTKDKPGQLFIIERLIGREVSSLSELTLQEWQHVRNDAFPYWREDDWTVGESFASKLHQLKNEYMEQHLGQMRLF